MIAGFRRGDAGAFDRLVTRYRQSVYGVVRRLLRTHEEADEAAQEAFLRAWNARESFRGDATFRTWLIRIAINAARTIGSRVPRESSLDEMAETMAETAGETMPETLPRAMAAGWIDPAAEPGQALDREAARRRVRRAIDTLPPRQREVVRLKVLSEMTHKEVAALLGLSEGAVKAHLHQAVHNLRKRLADPGQGATR